MLNNLIFKAYSYINNGNNQSFIELIEEHPWLINFKNQKGENLFLYAAKKDNLEILNFLLLKKPQLLSSSNNNNSKFLHFAFQNQSNKIIQHVFDYYDRYEKIFNSPDINDVYPIFILSQYGEDEQILKFLSKTPLEVIKSKDSNQNSIYHYLAYNDKCSKKILENIPISYIQYNKDNITALDIATQYNKYDIFRFFYYNKNTQYFGNIKLLHLSIANNDNKIYNCLIENHPEDIDDLLLNSLYDGVKNGHLINQDRLIKAISCLQKNNLDYFKTNYFENIFLKILNSSDVFFDLIKEIKNKEIRIFNNENIQKIFISSNSDNICNYLKLFNLDKKQKIGVIDKIIINKKQFFEKIDLIFDSVENFNEDESISIFGILKKIPFTQRISILNNVKFLNKISTKHQEEIKELNEYLSTKKIPDEIPSYFVDLYLSKSLKSDLQQIYDATNEKSDMIDFLSKKTRSIKSIVDFSFFNKKEKSELLSKYFIKVATKEMSDFDYEILSDMKNLNVLFKQINPYEINLKTQELLIEKNIKYKFNIDLFSTILGTQKELSSKYHLIFDGIEPNQDYSKIFDKLYLANFQQLKTIYETTKNTEFNNDFLNKFLITYNYHIQAHEEFLSYLLKESSQKNKITEMIFHKNYNISNIESYFSENTIKTKSIENQKIFYLKNFQLSLKEIQNVDFKNIDFISSKDYCEFLNKNKKHITNDLFIEKIISQNDNTSIFAYVLNNFSVEISSKQKFLIIKKYYEIRDNNSSLLNEKIDEFEFYKKNIHDTEFLNVSMQSDFFNKIDSKTKKLISSVYLDKKLTQKNTTTKINKI